MHNSKYFFKFFCVHRIAFWHLNQGLLSGNRRHRGWEWRLDPDLPIREEDLEQSKHYSKQSQLQKLVKKA